MIVHIFYISEFKTEFLPPSVTKICTSILLAYKWNIRISCFSFIRAKIRAKLPYYVPILEG